jgi:hypothetical protein
VEDGKCEKAIRVSRKLFLNIKKALDGEDVEENDYSNPLPFPLTKEILETIDGVELKETKPEPSTLLSAEILIELWKLIEVRKRIDCENNIENEWLKESEIKHTKKIQKILMELKSLSPEERYLQLRDLSNEVIDDKVELSENDFLRYLSEIID